MSGANRFAALLEDEGAEDRPVGAAAKALAKAPQPAARRRGPPPVHPAPPEPPAQEREAEGRAAAEAEPEGEAAVPLDIGAFPLSPERPEPRYDLFCVVDFECTCDEVNEQPHEIIEFPGVFLNARTLAVEFEFHRFVRPTERPRLTAFCTGLTGIEQESVDGAEALERVLVDFEEFCVLHDLVASRHPPPGARGFCVATDGPWDVRSFLEPECERKRIVGHNGPWQRIVNIRRLFHDRFKMGRGGVKDMLAKVGLDFQGREHSGLADSRNIARLLAVLLAAGEDVQPNLEVPFGIRRRGRKK